MVVSKWLATPTILIALLGFALLLSLLNSIRHNLEVAAMCEQSEIFLEVYSDCLDGDVLQNANRLRYIANYYPAGTKHMAGTMPSRIVESARKLAMAAIICDLRHKTEINLGDDPELWIKRFCKD